MGPFYPNHGTCGLSATQPYVSATPDKLIGYTEIHSCGSDFNSTLLRVQSLSSGTLVLDPTYRYFLGLYAVSGEFLIKKAIPHSDHCHDHTQCSFKTWFHFQHVDPTYQATVPGPSEYNTWKGKIVSDDECVIHRKFSGNYTCTQNSKLYIPSYSFKVLPVAQARVEVGDDITFDGYSAFFINSGQAYAYAMNDGNSKAFKPNSTASNLTILAWHRNVYAPESYKCFFGFETNPNDICMKGTSAYAFKWRNGGQEISSTLPNGNDAIENSATVPYDHLLWNLYVLRVSVVSNPSGLNKYDFEFKYNVNNTLIATFSKNNQAVTNTWSSYPASGTGYRNGNGQLDFRGRMSHLKVFTRIFSDADIAALVDAMDNSTEIVNEMKSPCHITASMVGYLYEAVSPFESKSQLNSSYVPFQGSNPLNIAITGGNSIMHNDTLYIGGFRDLLGQYWNITLISYNVITDEFTFYQHIDPLGSPLIFNSAIFYDGGELYRIGGNHQYLMDKHEIFKVGHYDNPSSSIMEIDNEYPLLGSNLWINIEAFTFTRVIPYYWFNFNVTCTFHWFSMGTAAEKRNTVGTFRPFITNITIPSGCDLYSSDGDIKYYQNCTAEITMLITAYDLPDGAMLFQLRDNVLQTAKKGEMTALGPNTYSVYWNMSSIVSQSLAPAPSYRFLVGGCGVSEVIQDLISIRNYEIVNIVPDTLALYPSSPGPYPLVVFTNGTQQLSFNHSLETGADPSKFLVSFGQPDFNYTTIVGTEFNCPVDIGASTAFTVVCNLPSFLGSNYLLRLQYDTGVVVTDSLITPSNGITTLSPTIYPTLLWYEPGNFTYQCSTPALPTYNCSDLVAPTSTSIQLLFQGENFGDTYPSVTYFQLSGWKPCAVIFVNDTHFACITSSGGHGLLNSFNVTFPTVSTIQPPVTISFPYLPQVGKIQGCHGYEDSSSSFKTVYPVPNPNSTYACPTEGNIDISVLLDGDIPGISVTISTIRFGSSYCTSPSLTGRNITCQLSSGQGFGMQIEVLAEIDGVTQSMSSNAEGLISYAGPKILDLSGCSDVIPSVLSDNITHFLPSECNRTGGEELTIIGENFGEFGPILVMISDSSCENPVRDSITPHNKVVCTLPSHSGGSAPIFISLQGQLSDETDFAVHYSRCPDGYAEPNCEPCEPGQYSTNGNVCTECEPGKYAVDSSKCNLCPIGKYRNDNTELLCTNCPNGTFSSNPGSTQCIACTQGSISGIGSSRCDLCEAGYESFDGIECVPCSVGTASLFPGDSCKLSPPGRFVASNASQSFYDCAPGKYQNEYGQEGCKSCSPGSYSYSRSEICSSCLSGSYQDLASQTSCVLCVPGRYQDQTGQTGCLPCQPGTFSIEGAQACDFCPIGKFSEEASENCQNCVVGKYNSESGQGCISCPVGTYSDAPGVSICAACPLGTFSNETGATSCHACQPGKAGNVDGLCIECSPGYYAPDFAADECIPAPKGSYISESGATRFELCPEGTYSEVLAATSCALCRGAPLSSEIGRQTCQICSPGKYIPTVYVNGSWKVVGETCLACPIGVNCEDPGFAFAAEGWWLSIDESMDSTTYGHVSAFKCLPNRCFDASICYSLGIIDPLPEIITTAPSTSESLSNLTQVFSTSLSGSGTLIVTTTTPTVTLTDKNLDILPGKTLACCTLKYNFRNEPKDSYRDSFLSNPMCGGCAENYYEWGSDCVLCDGVNWGAISLIIFVTWLMVIFFHYLSQITRAEIKIFFYFIQMVLLFFDSSTPWIRWLSFLSFDAVDSVNGVCIAPFEPRQKLMISLYVPFIAVAELFVTFIIGYLYWVFYHGGHTANWDRYKFRKSPYIRTVVALFLFVYYNITITVFEFFKCRSTGNGVKVVESYPGLECGSDVYQQMKPTILAFLVLATILSPFFIWIFLLLNKKSLGDEKFLERYGTLYETYSKRTYWWEFVCLVRRTVLIAFAVSLSENDYSVRMVVLSLVNLGILISHIYFSPFSKSFDNGIETFSLAILLFISVGLINVDLPLSAEMSIVFIFLVMSPLALFLIVYVGLRIFAYGFPDRYTLLMQSSIMSMEASFVYQAKRVLMNQQDEEDFMDHMDESVSSLGEYLDMSPW